MAVDGRSTPPNYGVIWDQQDDLRAQRNRRGYTRLNTVKCHVEDATSSRVEAFMTSLAQHLVFVVKAVVL